MKSFLIFLVFFCASPFVFSQQQSAAIANKHIHTSISVHPDTSTATILRDWFKPIEHPDKNFLKKQQETPMPAPRISNLQHTILHYSKDTYCGHPRMVNFNYFPPNEIIVGHFHA